MKIGKFKFTFTQALRLILQIVFFILLPSLYYNAFYGVKQVFLGIAHQSFSSALLPQLIEAIAIVPLTLLLGRFFCGWMCAFGSLGDFIYHIANKVFKVKFKMNEKVDAILKYVKYIWLAALVVFVWCLGSTAFSKANPWDVFGMIATVGKAPAISYVITNLTVGFLLFCLIFVGSIFVERFFCRYFCPLGAIFAVVSKLKVTRISKPREKCGKCRICTNNCAMGIPLYKNDSIGSGECINCMKCVSACPRHNVTLTVSGGDIRPLVAGTVAVAAMTGIYYVGNLATASSVLEATTSTSTSSQSSASSTASHTAVSSSVNEATASSTASQSSVSSSVKKVEASSASKSTSSTGKYKDGTYEGSGSGFRGATTTVSVTVSGGKITNIKTLSYGDDQQFFDRAYPTVTSSITSLQTPKVDAVSGATYSSNGIMEAVASALSKAG